MNRRDAVNSAEFPARRARVAIAWRDEVRIDPESTQGKPAFNYIDFLASMWHTFKSAAKSSNREVNIMGNAELIELWETEENHVFQGCDFSHLDGRWDEPDPPWHYQAVV